MSLLKTKKQKELERIWYAKLKEEGFEDCENTEIPDHPLKQWDTTRCMAKEKTRRDASEEYYRTAERLTHIYKFQRLIHLRIWELHCQGKSRREIEQAIEKSRFKHKLKQTQIQHIINKISKEFL